MTGKKSERLGKSGGFAAGTRFFPGDWLWVNHVARSRQQRILLLESLPSCFPVMGVVLIGQ